MVPQVTLQEFDKWVIDFMGPISPRGKCTGTHYIITTTNYLTRWVEATRAKDSTIATATKFVF